MLSTYIFLIVTYSWIDPVIIMQCPSLFLVTILKSVLSEYCYFLLISICMIIFFTFILQVSLPLNCVSGRQHIQGSCFCIHPVIPCDLVVAFIQLTFKAIIDMYDPITEKAMAPHSSTLAWKILWTEEPSRLQSMGS